MAHTKPRLTPLQRAFVREFVSSDDPLVRGNATAAYRAAGGKAKTEETAAVVASQTLRILKVQRAIETAHLVAEAEAIGRLIDWKTAAIEAQPTLLALAKGYLPEGRMETPLDVARAHIMLAAIREVMDRAFPKALYVRFDARAALAKLLGVPQEAFPDNPWDDEEDC
jgi:hypothetical protein